MSTPKHAVPEALLSGLLADYKKPEDLIGENGLLKQLTKLLVEKALDVELAALEQRGPCPRFTAFTPVQRVAQKLRGCRET